MVQWAAVLKCLFIDFRIVAESLKTGRSVMPEAFESVSVLFLDIVCFPAIAALSSPTQLVTFLNALYAEFDDIIGRHDAYKVTCCISFNNIRVNISPGVNISIYINTMYKYDCRLRQ